MKLVMIKKTEKLQANSSERKHAEVLNEVFEIKRGVKIPYHTMANLGIVNIKAGS